MTLTDNVDTRAERRRRLSLLAQEDLRLASIPGPSLFTRLTDIGFWVLYVGAIAVIGYMLFCRTP